MRIVLVTLAQRRRGITDLSLDLSTLAREVSLLRRGRGEGTEPSLGLVPGHAEVLLVLVGGEVARVVVADIIRRRPIHARVMEAGARITSWA